jgi:Ca2+-binding RTX toxin-like protein
LPNGVVPISINGPHVFPGAGACTINLTRTALRVPTTDVSGAAGVQTNSAVSAIVNGAETVAIVDDFSLVNPGPPGGTTPGTCNGLPAIDYGSGSDVVNGTAGDDVVILGSGNDTFNVGVAGGNDTICGGSGNDVITTGAGADYVNGGSGNDVINTGTGIDTIFGGSGNDSGDSGAEADIVDGGSGNDTIA